MIKSLNYRHAFHAGNFADVHKHAALTLLLQAMGRKDSPFFYFETHAGAGRYDLHDPDASRTREWEDGIGCLWSRVAPRFSGASETIPAPLTTYLAIISALNPKGYLRHYPGSPVIAQACLRAQERMVLFDASFAAAQQLETIFASDKRVQVRIGDGYAALKPWLPPPERRGVIFIDPPFERNDEFKQLLSALLTVQRLFATGTVAIWFPLKDHRATNNFLHALQKSGLRRLLLAELRLLPADVAGRCYGSALLLHNPPWHIDQELADLGKALISMIAANSAASAEMRWLVGE